MFLRDRRVTTCPVGEDRQAILYLRVQNTILLPCVTQPFTDSGCLETLQVSEGDQGRVFSIRGTACVDLPCGSYDCYVFGTWMPFCYTSYDAS